MTTETAVVFAYVFVCMSNCMGGGGGGGGHTSQNCIYK